MKRLALALTIGGLLAAIRAAYRVPVVVVTQAQTATAAASAQLATEPAPWLALEPTSTVVVPPMWPPTEAYPAP